MPPAGPRTSTWAMRTVSRARRSALERERRALDPLLDRLFREPQLGWALTITTGFVLLCASIAVWSRSEALVAAGRVADRTAVARVEFSIDDPVATDRDRLLARQRTPRVYVADLSKLETIRASIENLPRTLAAAEGLGAVAPEVSRQFRLTESGLAAVRAQFVAGEVAEEWRQRCGRLLEALKRVALLDDRAAQREGLEGVSPEVELRVGDEAPRPVRRLEAIVNIKDERELAEAMTSAARGAGFAEPALSVVVSRLTTSPEATFAFDEAATVERQNARAATVPPVRTRVPVGQVLFREGEVLTGKQLDQYREELSAFARTADWRTVWLRRLSVLGAVGAIGGAVAGYLAMFCPPLRRAPGRMAGMGALLAGALLAAAAGTVAQPGMAALTAVAPTVFVAVVLAIAYDRRVALAVGALHAVLVCVALRQEIGAYALMITGVAVATLMLREIRDRRTLVRMGLATGAALALGTALVAMIDRPITDASLWQMVRDAGLAGLAGVSVGVVALAVLPAIERAFGVTTGMTLIELRDPKQPLLRRLQQLAPGTYNHSLNVASIAEAAAESIGADALLTYVGSLYHDVGKMNKPDYFVENQAGAVSRHDKLSPAMSLLVIVGHVKDGMALAEEADLPMALRHFIEAHHGTTLVEYFYQRARQQAERRGGGAGPGDDVEVPEEIEYRYPGPKPRTKEVAILMLADAVESATRSMAEPTPSRIDAMVRALASKRLMDGQFDECDLTLRELQQITESISKSVAAIYHGRVVYQSTASLAGPRTGELPPREASVGAEERRA